MLFSPFQWRSNAISSAVLSHFYGKSFIKMLLEVQFFWMLCKNSNRQKSKKNNNALNIVLHMNSFECLSRHNYYSQHQCKMPTRRKKIQVYENNNETQILTTIQTCNRNRRKKKKKNWNENTMMKVWHSEILHRIYLLHTCVFNFLFILLFVLPALLSLFFRFFFFMRCNFIYLFISFACRAILHSSFFFPQTECHSMFFHILFMSLHSVFFFIQVFIHSH